MSLDLTGITTKTALHHLFKAELHFPDWYGVSWDAFWDCIIALKHRNEELEQTIEQANLLILALNTIGLGFSYLSLITDAYSKLIVGYCLHPFLTAEGTLHRNLLNINSAISV